MGKTHILLALAVLCSCASGPELSPQTLAAEYYNLGNAYYQLGKYKEAGDYYSKALAWDGSNPQAVYNLALSLSRQGQNQEALERLKSLAGKDPQNWILVKTTAYFRYLQGDKEGALSDYERVLEAGAGDADTLRAAGFIAQELKKNDRALVHLREWKKAGGTGSAGVLVLARLLLETGAQDEAVVLMESPGAGLDDNSDLALLLAETRLKQKAYDKVLTAWTNLDTADRKKQIKRPELWFEAGSLVLKELQDPVKSKEYFQRCIEQGFSDKTKVKQLLESPGLPRTDDLKTLFSGAKLFGEDQEIAKP